MSTITAESEGQILCSKAVAVRVAALEEALRLFLD
jgi:hypothetical protein